MTARRRPAPRRGPCAEQLAAPSLSGATAGMAISTPLILAILYALPAALLMNVYIVGLNQLFDIELDRINKPELPLAAGTAAGPDGATASTAALPPPSVSIIRNAADDAGSSLLVKFDDGTTDLITFAACATGELASVTRSGKIIGNITSRDIDMNRSQGHVGLTTLDAGKQ